ncbi:F-box/LRR-repeat protein 7 [Stylophora pistillata]|uniref:F-box/LRR-repeat protein 7 n=1 Tax=Stylophora pistillata TaxID=50429 RepID=A0A2B4S6E0_STYPI|nr:F-box/LRR-repeat protein 7 [Stylophora pistillata]
MENISKVDARALASNLVKNMQKSILTPDADVRNSSVVTTSFGSNAKPEVCEQSCKVEELNSHHRGTCNLDPNISLGFQKFAVDGGSGDAFERKVTSFERSSKQSNTKVRQSYESQGDGGPEKILNGETSSKSTPRVNVSFIRQKRLAFFDNSLGPKEGGGYLLQDNNRNVLTNISTSDSPELHVEARKCSSSSAKQFDVPLPSKCNGYARNDSLDRMYQSRSSETPFLLHSDKGTSMPYPYKSPPVTGLDHDEEDFRLELWGLKEAVHSGELDINAYVRKPTWKGDCYSSSLPGKCDDDNNDLHSGGKISSYERSKPIKIPKSPPNNQYLFYAKDDHGGKFANELNAVDSGYYSEEYRTYCNPTQISHGEHISNGFDGTEPQINGPLYYGFETSDSESSMLSFGSKCDDVHYRKVVKKQDPLVREGRLHGKQPRNGYKQQERKAKPKKGKEKILMELTEFIKESETPKYMKESRQGRRASDIMNGDNGLDAFSPRTLRDGLVEETSVTNSNHDLTIESKVCDQSVAGLSNHPKQSKGVKELEENPGDVMGKICPKCDEINSRAANWCIECGTALICVQASCLTTQQQKHFEKQCLETQALIKETLKTSTNLSHILSSDKALKDESSLNNDISSLSLQASQSTNDLQERKYSSSPQGYKRRWIRSSIAWSSYHSNELSKSHSFGKEKMKERNRATSFSDLVTCSSNEKGGKHKRHGRNRSTRQRTVSCSSFGTEDERRRPDQRSQTTLGKDCQRENNPRTCVVDRWSPPVEKQNKRTKKAQRMVDQRIPLETQSCPSLVKSSSSSSLNQEKKPTMSQAAEAIVPPLNLQDVESYDRILTLIRSQRDSDPVPYLCMPDELVLSIFSFLPHKDLVSCSRVCWQFYRISMDESLWKVIVVKKNNNITDEWLQIIGQRRPVSLTISQCRSDKVTAKGLRDLFRNCSDSLEDLNFSRCGGSEVIGESILLHVAARCQWLKSVDASWSNIGVSLPEWLPSSYRPVYKVCGKQTWQLITDSAIGSLVSNLPELENLDLRGCKHVRDSAVKKIVRHCPLITTLALANCPLITDVSLAEIATNLPKIRSLDICGCSKVSDNGICALSKNCHRLELLDLTSTGVGQKSVLSLANYCSQSLCNLKLSFCTDISENTVVHLAKQCKRLTMLHLYGCKRIRNTSYLRLLNPALTIEC